MKSISKLLRKCCFCPSHTKVTSWVWALREEGCALAWVPAGTEAFCILWPYFDFLDVTLAWEEGRPLQAHLVILAPQDALNNHHELPHGLPGGVHDSVAHGSPPFATLSTSPLKTLTVIEPVIRNKCNYCDFVFKTSEDLINHMGQVHISPPSCQKCGKATIWDCSRVKADTSCLHAYACSCHFTTCHVILF